MVNLKDPEEPEPIAADEIFPKEKVEKEAIEVVPISAEELAKQQKKNAEQRALEEKQEKEKLKRERNTIVNRKKQTSIELAIQLMEKAMEKAHAMEVKVKEQEIEALNIKHAAQTERAGVKMSRLAE